MRDMKKATQNVATSGFVHRFNLNVMNPETHFFQPGDGHKQRNPKSFGSGRLLPERKSQCTVPSIAGAGHRHPATLRASPRAAVACAQTVGGSPATDTKLMQ